MKQLEVVTVKGDGLIPDGILSSAVRDLRKRGLPFGVVNEAEGLALATSTRGEATRMQKRIGRESPGSFVAVVGADGVYYGAYATARCVAAQGVFAL